MLSTMSGMTTFFMLIIIGLFPFVCMACLLWLSSHLFYDNFIAFSSATGVQQGDPLGPVLFSLTIHSLASEIASILKFGIWKMAYLMAHHSLSWVSYALALTTADTFNMDGINSTF